MPEIFDVGQAKPLAEQALDAAQDGSNVRAQQARQQQARAEQGGQNSAGAADQPYETQRPQRAPSTRVLTEGAVLDVVLINEINTQNPGNVQLRLVSDVYDSLGHRQLLIPKGARLIASYGAQNNRVGLDRISLQVRRIVFPDGRSLAWEGSPITDA
ncbi:MAG: TrbI/VirB10 family protein, partial [Tepidimonas ignava]